MQLIPKMLRLKNTGSPKLPKIDGLGSADTFICSYTNEGV